ncbi:MAG: hypothetical protein ABSE22_09980 [Xanthobacteraceae bacterium]
MADDVALWFLLAIGIAFIYFGCIFTAGPKQSLKSDGGVFEQEMDRAA